MAGPRDAGAQAPWTGGRGTGAAVVGALALVVLCAAGAAGLALHEPWLFPSLGPTVMIVFETPTAQAAHPRDTLVGHGVGLVVGAGCLAAFGLAGAPSAVAGGLTVPHVLAGALSVALTAAVLVLLRVSHPPAGATTLIVGLGILQTPVQLLSMAGAIVLVTTLCAALNRLRPRRRAAAR